MGKVKQTDCVPTICGIFARCPKPLPIICEQTDNINGYYIVDGDKRIKLSMPCNTIPYDITNCYDRIVEACLKYRLDAIVACGSDQWYMQIEHNSGTTVGKLHLMKRWYDVPYIVPYDEYREIVGNFAWDI